MTPTIYPYLSYRDTAALRFFEEAFGFTTGVRWDAPDGAVRHAEVTFGDGAVMVGTADHPTAPLDGTSVGQGVYVYAGEDVERALRSGAGGGRLRGLPAGGHRVGDRRYRVLDPGGYDWSFGSYRTGEAGGS